MKRKIFTIFAVICLFSLLVNCVDINAISIVDRIPLIFSHDGAPDDIAALAYISKNPEIELLGVINSYGEQHPSRSKDEWQRYLYEVIDYDSADFGVGSEKSVDPAQNQFPSSWRDGADNFWYVDLPPAAGSYESSAGVDLIIDLVKNSSEKVTILILGGHTDVALAIEKDASIKDNIKEIVVMGGAFDQDGNLYEASGHEDNRTAEWNIFVDPLAASQVFTSGIPVTVVPLDGSDDFYIDHDDLALISNSDDPVLQVLEDLWTFQIEMWGGGEFKIWDIVAATAVTEPEYFEWVEDGIDVVTEPGSTHGKTYALDNDFSITRYATGTDFDKVREAVFDVLLSPGTPATDDQDDAEQQDDGSVENVNPLDAIAGTWTGKATAGDGTKFTIHFNLNRGCQLDQKCGRFNIDEWGISGDVTFTDMDGNKFKFEATNRSGAPESEKAYEEYLRLTSDTQVEYYSRGSYGTSEGVLSKE